MPSLLDVRSLRLFRIAVGVLLVLSILQRASEFVLFFGDEAAVPAGALSLLYGSGYPLVPSDQGFWVIVLALGLFCGLALVCGRAISLASGLGVVVLGLLHARNPLIEYGADLILRFEIFYVFLLSLLPKLSIRSPLKYRAWELSIHGALVLQLAAIYVCSTLARDIDRWWRVASALQETFHWDSLATPLARWLAHFETLCVWGTRGAFILELFGPLLLIGLWRRWKVRTLLILVFIAFHITIAMTLGLVFFAMVMVAFWVAIIPADAWERAGIVGWGGGVSDRVQERVSAVRFATIVLSLLLLGLSLTVPSLRALKNADQVPLLTALGYYQRWTFFAPTPFQDDGWFTLTVPLQEGGAFDLISKVVLSEPFPDVRNADLIRTPPPSADYFRALPRTSLRTRQLRMGVRVLRNTLLTAFWVRSLCQHDTVSSQFGGRGDRATLMFWSELTESGGAERDIEGHRIGDFLCYASQATIP